MVSASSIAAARGGGYARYLEGRTVEPERGDYYLQPGGQPTAAPGRWLADEETLARLGITSGVPVEAADFVALMEGRDPRSGRWIRPPGADGGRGGGVDLTFSAPKSVSVAWALADSWQRDQIEQAHAIAVERSIDYLRAEIPAVRRRRGGPVLEEPAKDLVAAAYLIVVDRPKRARGSLADRIEPLFTEERAGFTASTLRAPSRSSSPPASSRRSRRSSASSG